MKKTQAQRIADVRLLELKKQIESGKALELIFAIRAEYERKVEQLLFMNNVEK